MTLTKFEAPYIRHRDTNRTLMLDILIALMFLYVVSVYYYGMRSVLIAVYAILTSVITETVCSVAAGRGVNVRDYSCVVTALLISMMMPAAVPYYVVVLACIFANVVAKQAFGGTGQNLFNPAAAGMAFAMICWPKQVFTYSMPLDKLPIAGEVITKLAESPAFTLKLGGIPDIEPLELLLGNFPGPLGATNILVMSTCLIYLILRKTVNWRIPVFFIGTATVLAWAFPRIPAPRMESVVFELMSGTMVFCAIFSLTDPVTSPKRGMGKILYAVIAGVVTMLFRRYSELEQVMPFVILLMNAFTPMIDRLSEYFVRVMRRLDFGKEAAGA